MKAAIFNPDVDLAWYKTDTPYNLATTMPATRLKPRRYGISNNNRRTDPVNVSDKACKKSKSLKKV